MGHVQDTPVSTSMIPNVYMICHMKVHIVSYNLDQKNVKIQNSTLPNYEQTDLKTTIVGERANSTIQGLLLLIWLKKIYPHLPLILFRQSSLL